MSRYFCLRDDDTSFYTSPKELIEGYGAFWGSIPITLATVPFVHASSVELSKLYVPGKNKFECLRAFEKEAPAAYLNDYHKIHPIGDNRELTDMLKPMVKNGMVEIALHGVSHKYTESGPEMLSTKMSLEAIRDAKEYLEKVFEVPVQTFIPPSNTIDVQCVKWINSLGMRLMTSGPVCRNGNYKKMAIDFKTLPNRVFAKLFSDPWSARPVNHCFGMGIFTSLTYGASSDPDALLAIIKERLGKYGFGAIGTHYTCFADTRCRASFWQMLDAIKGMEDTVFVTASRYYDLLKEKK